ncbi:hypothetical protein AGLY_007273 [Aphis glycines]|uniref:Uncharacterized protein n=1 Tax=Aphis glycines TaxID=307491 RepID=A0A6G0TRE3_APHGL|nr:hypothetical protein AGLY_007273 [Aphis glycines]
MLILKSKPIGLEVDKTYTKHVKKMKLKTDHTLNTFESEYNIAYIGITGNLSIKIVQSKLNKTSSRIGLWLVSAAFPNDILLESPEPFFLNTFFLTHNSFQLVIGKHHPDLYSILSEFQKEQADAMIIIAELSLGRNLDNIEFEQDYKLQEMMKKSQQANNLRNIGTIVVYFYCIELHDRCQLTNEHYISIIFYVGCDVENLKIFFPRLFQINYFLNTVMCDKNQIMPNLIHTRLLSTRSTMIEKEWKFVTHILFLPEGNVTISNLLVKIIRIFVSIKFFWPTSNKKSGSSRCQQAEFIRFSPPSAITKIVLAMATESRLLKESRHSSFLKLLCAHAIAAQIWYSYHQNCPPYFRSRQP